MKRAMPIVLIIVAVLALACLGVVAIGFFFLRGIETSLPAGPTSVMTTPGFDGQLEATWRERRGGFTGVEAASDGSLTEKWPDGSVTELSLEAGGEYRFTFVESRGAGVNGSKTFVREVGAWRREADELVLTPRSGQHSRRFGAAREELAFSVTGPRRYRLETREEDFSGTPGATPTSMTLLQLTGACLGAPGECTLKLEAD